MNTLFFLKKEFFYAVCLFVNDFCVCLEMICNMACAGLRGLLWKCLFFFFLSNPMDDCVTVVSVNCQGLGNRQKRKDVFHYLRKKNYSIYFLQDTHFEPKMEMFISAVWGYESYFSSYSSSSRGVTILFNNNFEFKVKDIHKGDIGNYNILTVRIKEIDILFGQFIWTQ